MDEAGTVTRQRLLAGAVAACVERGFEGTTVADIAKRAGVSAPAIYNHFGGKSEVMVEAGRWALAQLRPEQGPQLTPAETARAFLGDAFADTRRLLSELHLAGQRHPEVADLLAKWHGDHAAGLQHRLPGPQAEVAVKTYFAMLLGLCQIDSLGSLPASKAAIGDQVEGLLRVLLPEGSHR